uniref:Putative Subtilase family protein n=1 Tax=uncultured marine crenarchaeote HF4000_ANIW93J19 TaxID=455566 RepID=B3T312_9ARCH|nr:putative Subtilase family protein [uncultured marine crenarchaeote HF4000_ANIW93J19]
MPKLALFLSMFFLLILFQQSSYGFIEGAEVPTLSNFAIERTSDIISIDLPHQENPTKRYLVYGSGSLNSAYSDTKNIAYGINSDKGFFSVGILSENEASKLKSKGYYVIEDLPLDFHSKYVSTNAITKISQFGNIANSEQVHKLYDVTGKGVTVAVVDTGVDFSNPDIMESLARDDDNNPIMLDADGQGLVLTNATFAVNIHHGKVYNFTKNAILQLNSTSNVYESNDGIFLNTLAKNGTISIYNSLYPYYSGSHVLNAKVTGDMKIGASQHDFIPSKSGIYHLGAILASHYGKLQVLIVLVTDPNQAGVYDTITPDMSTSWMDFTKEKGVRPSYDFDFTDETPITIGSGDEFLLYDSDDDGINDYSAGTVGARVVDIYGIISDKAEIDDNLGAVNGTLLPAMDKNGNYFGIMNDFYGHGTATSAIIASKGKMEYDIYNDTKKSTILGIAPDVNILPVKSLWFGDVFYGWMWAAGFENEESKWVYAGEPKADIISNSWGVSNFPSLEYAPGLDISSHILNALAIPQLLHQNYTGTTIISSAGNNGHGYGTIGMPGISSFGISVGAVTSNDFVGYGPFKGQPRFGNTTDNSDHVVDFSGRGPGVIGDPKPDLMSIGAYSFVPSAITKLPDEPREPFSLFGGTSMSAPIAAGSAALVIESLKEKSVSYDPFMIRNLLMSSAGDLRNDPLTQGAGLVNALDAVRIVNGHGGKFLVHNDATFSNIKQVIDISSSSFNSDLFGIDEFGLSDKTFPMTSWYGGRLNPGEESTTTYTIENPNNYTINVKIKPETLKLIENLQMSGVTEPHLQDPILNENDTYRPNYIKLSNIPAEHRISNETSIIHPDSSLMILNLHFPFDTFMNQTDTTYADDLKISSLYVYDWEDKNTDDEISSDELSMVSRGGSWGTVQEIRISDPLEKFENEPVIGVYPVPKIFSFWKGNTNQNSTSMDYTLSTSYYQNVLWDDITVSGALVDDELTIFANDFTDVRATLSVPSDRQTGVYQGFLSFEGKYHKINAPVSYGVLETVEKDVKQTVISGSVGDALYGNGFVKGAFDMTSRYMAGDWRQYYFDIQDHTINSATIDFEWENDNTNFTVFMIDPQGKIIQTNFPPGVFGEFLGWPTSDWLGTSSFSGGGTFYPLKNRDNTSTVLFAPINQTGTYTLLVHSTLFDGTSITEPISLAAKFTTIVPDIKPPEIIFEIPELINKTFDILPEIIEKNPDFVKYYLDGEEREQKQLPLRFGMLPDGKHDLRIHATDIVGNEAEKTFSFTIDNAPPEILVKSPINGTTVSHSLQIDFKVKDENLAEDGAITILLPDGESLDDVTFHSFNVTGIDDGVYDLKIMAVDLAENEQTKMISFNVDHAFVQPPPVISKERGPVSENNLLIIISVIIVAAIVITIIVKRIRKTSTENKILKEDL